MADIKNKNELKRRTEMFLDEFSNEEYKANEEFCKETMRMMRGFIGRACHLLDCEKRISENLKQQLKPYKDLEITAEQVKDIDKAYTDLCAEFGEYKKLEERGLLLKLPCNVGDTVYFIRELCDQKGTMAVEKFVVRKFIKSKLQSFIVDIEGHMLNIASFGKTVFLTKEAAEQALKRLESES